MCVANSLEEASASTPRAVARLKVKDLPEKDQFDQLSTKSKHFIDTIKMIAYHAETVMANLLRETLSRPDEVRRFRAI